jgi:predicted phage terminase large subunit-like protein
MKSDLKGEIERRARAVNQARNARESFESLFDVMARVSPELDRPQHLWPYIAIWDHEVMKAPDQPGLNVVFHAPPQHGKSLTGYHGLLFAVLWDLAHGIPPRHHAYSTYNADKAKESMKDVVLLAKKAGLNPKPSGPHLHLEGGAVIHFMGAVAGTLTGHKVDGIHLIDDPIKDRKEANSVQLREDRWNWLLSVAFTRRHIPSSVIVMHTRWHHDDLAGRLIHQRKWPYLRLAAECDTDDDPLGRQLGEMLWPAKRPLSLLADQKLSQLTWESMYQGRPRPVGDTLFQDAIYYDGPPPAQGYKVGYGCDLAYTGTTRSDWSVLLGGRSKDKLIYLTSNLRHQMQADRFTRLMKAKCADERGPILWFGNSVERGAASLIRAQIPLFRFQMAVADKYVRALPCAEKLWNQQRILVPRDAPWVDEFVHEIGAFSGQGDLQDDQVDALAALGSLFLKGSGNNSGLDLNSKLLASVKPHIRLVA